MSALKISVPYLNLLTVAKQQSQSSRSRQFIVDLFAVSLCGNVT